MAGSATSIQPGLLFADRYEVEELVGRGGMGEVWRVHDRVLGETVALKLLAAQKSASQSARKRFLREVRLARKVTHRNVARVYDVGDSGGQPFLTMEYVEGQTLRARLRSKGRMPLEEVAGIGLELCAGLDAAHQAGVIHRDLKPSNVLLEREGRVVITDFGIARQLTVAPSITAGAIGTPMYMAPEQHHTASVDARADIYALAVMLYEMIAGELPDRGRVGDAPLPDRLRELLSASLSSDPADRPATVAPLRGALREVVGSCPTQVAAAPGPHVATPREAAIPLQSAPLASSPDAATRADRGAAAVSADFTLAQREPEERTLSSRNPGPTKLAVLPFRFHGPEDCAFFGEALTDELIDTLATTRDLRVLASGSAARFSHKSDPRAVGKELGVDHLVEGTVQFTGELVRISARLVEVQSGAQVWSDRWDGGRADVLALQQIMARRIAEQLRAELRLRASGPLAPEAIELYLRARRRARALAFTEADGAVALLERALEIEPGFSAALGALALASVRGWLVPVGDTPRPWKELAAANVERALADAPEMAESHLAAGMFSAQQADYARAASALGRAVHLAPTYAEAQEYLGHLQYEAGLPEEGVRRLTLATELDPTLTSAWLDLARHHALHGRFADYESIVRSREMREAVGPLILLQVRVGAWRRDLDALRALGRRLAEVDTPMRRVSRAYVEIVTGEAGEDAIQAFAAAVAAHGNPRFRAFMGQLHAEAVAARGLLDRALAAVVDTADGALVDLEWLDHCAPLEPIRERVEFVAARRKVRARCQTLWAV